MATLSSYPNAVLIIAFLATSFRSHAEERSPSSAPNKAAHRLWKPIPDEVYYQEIAQKITTDKPVTSLAVHQGEC